MQSLDKTEILNRKKIKPSHLTDLYDYLTGDSQFDNIKLNGVKTYKARLVHTYVDSIHSVVIEQVFENSIGADPTFTYEGTGHFSLTFGNDLVPADRTHILASLKSLSSVILSYSTDMGNDYVIISARMPDGQVYYDDWTIDIDIKVYPMQS